MGLTDLKARTLRPSDAPVSDGVVTGLRLEPGAERGRGKWVLRYVSPITGKRRDMGLKTYPEVGIAEARAKALEARELIRGGHDPIDARRDVKAARKRDAAATTFENAARAHYADIKSGWKNEKHASQWIGSLEVYVFPKIGKRLPNDLRVADFADVLKPIWLKLPETASRVKQRCHAVMESCIAHELAGVNPVASVTKLLPKQPSVRERVVHQPAVPWEAVPDFVATVLRDGEPTMTKAMLELLILTAARSGEIRGMAWSEIDFDTALWTVPAQRMKAGVLHRVPLSWRAIEILREREKKGQDSGLVFPTRAGTAISDMAMTKLLRDKKVPSGEPSRTATVHGFRSSFRDWAGDNSYPDSIAERALAHQEKDAVVAAYARSEKLDARTSMMNAWADYVCGLTVTPPKVIPFRSVM